MTPPARAGRPARPRGARCRAGRGWRRGTGTLRAVSAAWRTTGLALKAMPSPAAASMSMSLAPSPTAMVRASGTPAASAKIASAAAFPARSMIGPVQLAGDDARLHGQHVGRQVVDAQIASPAGRSPG